MRPQTPLSLQSQLLRASTLWGRDWHRSAICFGLVPGKPVPSQGMCVKSCSLCVCLFGHSDTRTCFSHSDRIALGPELSIRCCSADNYPLLATNRSATSESSPGTTFGTTSDPDPHQARGVRHANGELYYCIQPTHPARWSRGSTHPSSDTQTYPDGSVYYGPSRSHDNDQSQAHGGEDGTNPAPAPERHDQGRPATTRRNSREYDKLWKDWQEWRDD